MAKDKSKNITIDANYIDDGQPAFGYPTNEFSEGQLTQAGFKFKGGVAEEGVKIDGRDATSIQDINKNILGEKKYYVDSAGNPYFKNFDQNEIAALDQLFKDLEMGTLDVYKGSLAKILKNTETKTVGGKSKTVVKDFDVGEFQDLVGFAFQKNIDEIAPRITMEETMKAAKKIKSSVFYRKMLSRQANESLDNPTFMRALIEAQILMTKLDGLTEYIAMNGYTDAAAQSWNTQFNYLQLLVTESAAEARKGMQKGVITKNVGAGFVTDDDYLARLQKIADDMSAVKAGDLPSKEVFMSNIAEYRKLNRTQVERAAELAKHRGPNWWDALAELYTNAKLFHPWTLAINAMGNFTLQVSDFLETGVAAGINKIPGFKAEDGVALEEFTNYLHAVRLGAQRGSKQVAEYRKTGQTIGNTNKFDQRHDGNAISRNLIKGSALSEIPLAGNAAESALDIFGTLVNTPKHLMIMQDEITKSVIFDTELMKHAMRQRAIVLKRTGDVKQADLEVERIIHNPDEYVDIYKDINQKMLERTFQKELPDGIFKNFQKVANMPVMKLFLPFYKTIVNIFFETTKRTPGMNMLMPSVRKDLFGNNGEAARQMAYARTVTGFGFMAVTAPFVYTPGDFADGKQFIITGHASPNREEAKAQRDAGILPYSIAIFDPDTGKYNSINYSRLEPMGQLMGFTADMFQAANVPSRYGDDGSSAEELLFAWFNTAYGLLGNQSFSQFFNDIAEVLPSGNTGEYLTGMALEGVTNKLLDVFEVTTQLGFGRSAKYLPTLEELTAEPGSDQEKAYLDRIFNNTKENVRITDDQFYNENFFVKMLPGDAESWSEFYNGDIPPHVEAFAKKLNRIYMGSPLYNSELQNIRTEFGAEIKDPTAWSPLPVSQLDGSLLNNFSEKTGFYLRYSGANLGPIKLTGDEEVEKMIALNKDRDGDGVSDYKQAMIDLVSSSEFLNLGQRYSPQGKPIGGELQLKQMRAIQAQYNEIADIELLQENPELLRRYSKHFDAIDFPGAPRLDRDVLEGN